MTELRKQDAADVDTHPPLVISPRGGKMGYELARDFVHDPRLKRLSLRALGAFILIKANEEARQPIDSGVNIACRVLGVQNRTFHEISKELTENPMGLPLIVDDGKFLRANPFGKPMLASTLKARVEAGKKRRIKAATEPATEPVKTKKRKAKPSAIPAAQALAASLVDGLIKEVVKADVSPAQAPLQLNLLGDAPEAAPSILPSEGEGSEVEDAFVSAKREAVPYARIGQMFNERCQSLPSVLSAAQWSSRRRHDLMIRWREKPSLTYWEEFFDRVEKSNFLCGRIKTFRVSFDWILNASNFQKINEGNYDNRSGGDRRQLFGQGDNNFKVGTYGDHDIGGEDAPWNPKPIAKPEYPNIKSGDTL